MAKQTSTGVDILRVRDISRRLGVGRSRVIQMARRGEIPMTRLGSQTLVVPVDTWEAWLAAKGAASLAELKVSPSADEQAQ